MPDERGQSADELTSDQKREHVIRLAFGGSVERFEELCRIVREDIPEGTGVVLRGSAVTGTRWKDGAPFDADGPGTSDLDLTLVRRRRRDGTVHADGLLRPRSPLPPLSNEDPDIAPALVPLRERLMAMVKRPVNIQGSRDVVLYLRGELMGQPYLVLIDKPDEP